MNNDLTSREELKKAIETYDKFACLPDTRLIPFRMLNEPEKDYEPYVHLRDIQNAIDNAPTVCGNNPKWCESCVSKGKCASTRPQGKWIDHSDDEEYVECPICGHLTNCEGNVDELHYCWNCGAKMKGGAE